MSFKNILGQERCSLVLMHPTSLPDPEGAAYGVGEIGSEAFRFAEFLRDAGVGAWQILPLGHTGYMNSPYQTFSRFAGSPYLISVEKLLAVGDLTRAAHDEYVRAARDIPAGRSDFGWLFYYKLGGNWEAPAVLRRAFEHFMTRQDGHVRREAFNAFCAKGNKEFGGWLTNYAEYMGIKEFHNHICWADWPAEFRDVHQWRKHRPDLLAHHSELKKTITFYQYLQFIFFEQWQNLKKHVNTCGRRIVGDIPWYVGYDSSDVWANREVFELDFEGRPLNVAGVPPDYFSATGQLWGNPLYNWENPATFAWWLDAVSFLLAQVDVLRLDHFRAIDSYWKIPFDWAEREKTAVQGCWGKAPGHKLLAALTERLKTEGRTGKNGQLPMIAEDLGFLDPLYPAPEQYPDGWNWDSRFRVTDAFMNEMVAIRDAAHEAVRKNNALAAENGNGGNGENGGNGVQSVEPAVPNTLGLAFSPLTGEYSTRKGVDVLLEEFRVPRMEVLQFCIEGGGLHGVRNACGNFILYTGTHDNDTALGWYRTHVSRRMEHALKNGHFIEVADPLDRPVQIGKVSVLRDASWEMIQHAFESPAPCAGAPMQDLLGLGSEARMNLPGDNQGAWWGWRAERHAVDYPALCAALRQLNDASGRTAV